LSREHPLENSLPLPVSSDHDASNEGAEECDESGLVEAAKADARFFGRLYARYVRRVYRYMRTRTDDEEDAADLTHQVFLHALDALPKYRERGLPFAAWLFRISRNVAADFHRRRQRRATVPWESLPHIFHPVDPRDYEHEVLQQQERLEDIARVKALIEQLDPEQRELIALRFFAGLSLSEIAKVVKTSQGTVQRQMVRVLQTLKEQLKEQYDESE
jgi:RNA polymerase sigma-70 factor (ECF subfamily)